MMVAPAQQTEPLTPMEECCLVLLFDGLSDHAIGERLHLGERTVSTYLSRIRIKLGVPAGRGGWICAARRLHVRRCSRCS